MMKCSLGTVVLVRIMFSDGLGSKSRPAIVVSSPRYHSARQDAVIVALTSQLDRTYFGDCEIRDWKAAGLKRPSIAKGFISTIKRTTISRELGFLGKEDYNRVKDSVRSILAL